MLFISQISLELKRLLKLSTNRNSEAVEKEWATIIKLTKKKFKLSPKTKQSINQFISIIVVKATIFFKSC